MNATVRSLTRFLVPVFAAVVFRVPTASGQPVTRFDSATDWDKLPKLFKPHGVKPGRVVTVRADGIHYEFGPLKESRIAGMRGEITLRGDFEISLRYELIDFPAVVADGDGLTVGVTVASDPKLGLASVRRGLYRGRGDQHRLTRGVMVDGRMTYAITGVPTESKNGRIVMRRVGSEVIGLSADEPDGELVEWKRYPFTDQPARVVHLYADSGGAADAAFTARLYDLQIRTGGDVPTQPAKPGPVPQTITPLPEVLPPTVGPAPRTTPADGPPVGGDAATDTPTPTRVRGYWWLLAFPVVGAFAIGLFLGRKRWQRPTAPRRPVP